MTDNTGEQLAAAHERSERIQERLGDFSRDFDETVFDGTALDVEGLDELIADHVIDPAQALHRAVNAAMADPSKME